MPGSPASIFFDTNVLLYLASADDRKAAKAEELLAGGGTVSVQILNEIASVARRKMNMEWNETISFVDRFRLLLDVVPVTETIHENGLLLAQRYRLSVYDGFVVSAALDAKCSVLLSEDMQDGLVVEKHLEIRNPFA